MGYSYLYCPSRSNRLHQVRLLLIWGHSGRTHCTVARESRSEEVSTAKWGYSAVRLCVMSPLDRLGSLGTRTHAEQAEGAIS